MNQNTILWVDDIREPEHYLPEGIVVDIARTYIQAVKLLSEVNYDEIYLDHDLGDWQNLAGEKTGYDIVLWLVERKMDGQHVPSVYHYLTANPVGRERMKGTIERYLS